MWSGTTAAHYENGLLWDIPKAKPRTRREGWYV